MAVVSDPAKAMLTAMTRTRSSVKKSGRSSFALRNMERRSPRAREGAFSGSEERRSAMRALANFTTGKGEDIML